MQLVNLDSPQSIISQELITTIQSGDLEKSKGICENVKDYKSVLRSFYLLSCRQSGIENTLKSAVVYTDAIFELIKRLFPEDPALVLDASLEYYCSINYDTPMSQFPTPDADDLNSPVVVKELSESLQKGELERSFKISKKMLTVMDSKLYFNELLMEEATISYTESGESIIVINSICKAMELFEWKMIDELLWAALKLLTSKEFLSKRKILQASNEETKYAEYAMKAASNPGENGTNLLFLSHARQIYRAVSVKHKEIWAYLSSFIQTKLTDLRIEEMEEIEPVKGDIVDFEKSIEMLDVRLSMTFVNQILKSEINVGEIFGTIALHILEKGKFKSPEIMIYLNTARRIAFALEYPRNLIVYQKFLTYLYSDNAAN